MADPTRTTKNRPRPITKSNPSLIRPYFCRTISAATHHHAVDFNIFEGMTVHGVAEYVLSNGRVVVDEGQLKVVQGMGRYIPNPPFSPYVYDLVRFFKLIRN